jgi:acyl carrier protein
MTADFAPGQTRLPAAPTEFQLADFVRLLRDEIGLDVAEADLARSLDEVPGWDSVHLLTIITRLEERVRRQLSLPDFLDAPSLAAIYDLVSR